MSIYTINLPEGVKSVGVKPIVVTISSLNFFGAVRFFPCATIVSDNDDNNSVVDGVSSDDDDDDDDDVVVNDESSDDDDDVVVACTEDSSVSMNDLS